MFCSDFSFADAGQFFLGGDVDDFKCFGMKCGIGPELQFAEITFLHLDEMFFVFSAQALENRRVNDDAKLEVGFVAGASL